jgi:hypothetical protein
LLKATELQKYGSQTWSAARNVWLFLKSRFRSEGAADDEVDSSVPLFQSGNRNRKLPDVSRLATLLMRLPTH